MPYARKNGCNYYDGKITKLTERLNWNVNRDDIALRCKAFSLRKSHVYCYADLQLSFCVEIHTTYL